MRRLLASALAVVAVDAARGRWQAYKDAGHRLTYWQQTVRGGWKEKGLYGLYAVSAGGRKCYAFCGRWGFDEAQPYRRGRQRPNGQPMPLLKKEPCCPGVVW